MNLRVLIDNLTYHRDLISEHGLSYLITDEEMKVLFDTGQSDNFIKNSLKLGIDLSEIDYLVLSHGHYDHTGGIEAFFQINSRAKLLCKKEAFDKKYSKSTGIPREIGIKIEYEKYKNRIVFIEDNYDLTKNIKIITRFDSDIKLNSNFCSKDDNNQFISDKFTDEIFLILNNNYILSGCSHKGIENIIKEGKKYSNIDSFIGGMHLSKASDSEVISIALQLDKLGIKYILTGHCTGVEAYCTLKKYINKVEYAHTGKKIDL